MSWRGYGECSQSGQTLNQTNNCGISQFFSSCSWYWSNCWMGDMARVTGTAENTTGKNCKIKQIWLNQKAQCTLTWLWWMQPKWPNPKSNKHRNFDIAYWGFPTQTWGHRLLLGPHCPLWWAFDTHHRTMNHGPDGYGELWPQTPTN